MSDPLSVTASIIAVIQLTGTVAHLCYQYGNAVKGAGKDAARIANEVEDLRGVLRQLLSIAHEEEEAGTHRLLALGELTQPEGSLKKCYHDLDVLRTSLEPKTGFAHVRTSLVWPFKAGEVKIVLTGLERLKSTLQLAIVADSTKAIFRVEDSMGRVEGWTQELILSDTQRAISEWLQAPDPSLNHHAARLKHEPGTGEWLLQSNRFQDWLQYNRMFLWIYGLPGSGKTVLASTIVNHMKQRQPSQDLLYFYFTFNDQRKQEVDGMLRSLLAQVIACRENVPEQIKQLYNSSDQGRQQPDFASLRSTVLSVLQTFDGYLILDAADECSQRASLLEMINDVKADCRNINVLVTSRREQDLEATLHSESESTIYIEDDIVSGDIQLYIQSHLKSDQQLQRWSEDLKSEIEAALVSGARGMFRWVACQLDVLRECLKPKLVRKKLKELPKTLHETYDRILLNVPQLHCVDVHRALQWLVFSRRPMTLAELAEAVAVNVNEECFNVEDRFSSPSDLLRLCASLVTLQGAGVGEVGKAKKDGLREVGLAHYSVAEYLISDHIHNSEAKYFAITHQEAHEYMARSSLLYLESFDNLESFDKSVPFYESAYDDFPFLQYAATKWLKHFQAISQPSDLLLGSGCSFLQDASKPAYLIWLYVIDEAGSHGTYFCDEVGSSSTPTGLYFACSWGLLQLSKMMLDMGANANVQIDQGGALVAATKSGNIDLVHFLLDKGANANAKGGYWGNALLTAIAHEHIDIIRILLDNGAAINTRGAMSSIPLIVAIQKGNADIVRLLLDHGADDSAQGEWYISALQTAIFYGRIGILQFLLDKGANINTQGKHDDNALYTAISNDCIEVLRILLDEGVDVNACPRFNDILQLVERRGNIDMIRLLTGKDADATAQNKIASGCL